MLVEKMPTHSIDYRRLRVLVVGDCMLDRYVQGRVTRICPEAPVPVLSVSRHYDCLGGAGNVAAGIAALGAQVDISGIVGNDLAGECLRTLLDRGGIGAGLLVSSSLACTVCKTRVVADHQHQQLMRIDEDGLRESREILANAQLALIVSNLDEYDIVVLADYEKGSLPSPVIRGLIDACRDREIPVVVDPKKNDFSVYARATIVTPNLLELERAVGRSLLEPAQIVVAANALRHDCQFDYVLCTCGAQGMVLVGESVEMHIPACIREVAEVTGAGDTVVAVLTLCLGAGWPAEDACRLASLAAGIAVSHPHTYVVGLEELEQVWRGRSPKIVSAETASLRVKALQQLGKTIVFTNGCFDVLHAGHLASLETAKRLGDFLVLGLNSDTSVRRNKGASRPRLSQAYRAALLAGLACVDLVVIFDEDSPEPLIRQIEPDVLVKGGDYEDAEIVGADLVSRRGGRVVVVPHVGGLSSTAILRGTETLSEPTSFHRMSGIRSEQL